MRPAWFAVLLAPLACSGPGTTSLPVTFNWSTNVNWMEWPAQVPVATPFKVRQIVYRPCTPERAFSSPAIVDQSAVTFQPYFIVARAVCAYALDITVPVDDLYVGSLDTVAAAPGLAADYPRTYEMRATAVVYAALNAAASDLPTRTFGEVTVSRGVITGTRTNAGGFASLSKDLSGCLRLRPSGVVINTGYPVDNPDTVTSVYGLVRGYIDTPPAPVCGETRAFHLVSVN